MRFIRDLAGIHHNIYNIEHFYIEEEDCCSEIDSFFVYIHFKHGSKFKTRALFFGKHLECLEFLEDLMIKINGVKQ